MNQTVFGIENFEVYAVLGILIFFCATEILAGYLPKRAFDDWIQEFGGFLILAIIIKPLIVFLGYNLCEILFPTWKNILANWSIWLTLPLFLIIDDFIQYWHHRFSHEFSFLWKLHRGHHQAEEMGFFVSFRNSFFFYFLFPNIWWLAIFLFLGATEAAIIGIVFKQFIVIASHSTLKWDAVFYKHKSLNPFISIIEKFLITPAFHYSHHGMSKDDGISEPNRNYGNMFSIWDQLFKTAKFTQKFPTKLGLLDDPKEGWKVCYLYPLFASDNPKSEMYRQKNSV